MALLGSFAPNDATPYGKKGYAKHRDAEGYEIIADTKGKFLWQDAADMEKPYLILTSEQVTKEYLHYLDERHISWIACGKDKIDHARAAEILADVFRVKRMGIVGGAAINTAFLDAGLLDEISLLVGAGIDRRGLYGIRFRLSRAGSPVDTAEIDRRSKV